MYKLHGVPGGVYCAVNTLARAQVRQVERPDNVCPDRLWAVALAPVHVRPPRLVVDDTP